MRQSKVEVAVCPIVALAFLSAALWQARGPPARVGQFQRAPSLRQEWQIYDRAATCRETPGAWVFRHSYQEIRCVCPEGHQGDG